MPPAWFISTRPETKVVLQVPHIPSWHDEGRLRPAWAVAANRVVLSSHSTVRPLRRSSTVYVGPVDLATGAMPVARSNDSSWHRSGEAPAWLSSPRTASMYGAGPQVRTSRPTRAGATR